MAFLFILNKGYKNKNVFSISSVIKGAKSENTFSIYIWNKSSLKINMQKNVMGDRKDSDSLRRFSFAYWKRDTMESI